MSRAQEIVLEIKGMTCANCERHVSDSLQAVEGVTSVHASRSEGRAVITADPAVATVERLRFAIRDAGYELGEILHPE